MLNERTSGILLHPTSLPGPFGSGDFGSNAYRFVDWLEIGGLLYFCMMEGEGVKIVRDQMAPAAQAKILCYYQPAELEYLLQSINCPAVEAWYDRQTDKKWIHVIAKRKK